MAFFTSNGCAYVKTTVERSAHEALLNRSYCMKLKVGDIIELADGCEAVVADNDPLEQQCLCFIMRMGKTYCIGYSGCVVPYTVIKTPHTDPVPYRDFLRAEWESHLKALKGDEEADMAAFLDDLEELGIDYSAYGSRAALIASCDSAGGAIQ